MANVYVCTGCKRGQFEEGNCRKCGCMTVDSGCSVDSWKSMSGAEHVGIINKALLEASKNSNNNQEEDLSDIILTNLQILEGYNIEAVGPHLTDHTIFSYSPGDRLDSFTNGERQAKNFFRKHCVANGYNAVLGFEVNITPLTSNDYVNNKLLASVSNNFLMRCSGTPVLLSKKDQ